MALPQPWTWHLYYKIAFIIIWCRQQKKTQPNLQPWKNIYIYAFDRFLHLSNSAFVFWIFVSWESSPWSLCCWCNAIPIELHKKCCIRLAKRPFLFNLTVIFIYMYAYTFLLYMVFVKGSINIPFALTNASYVVNMNYSILFIYLLNGYIEKHFL